MQLDRIRPLVAALAALLVVPLAALRGAEPAVPPDAAAVRVTAADVAAANEEVRMAYGALVAMWREDFARIGAAFAPPRIARYRAPVRTVCGVMQPGNAAYCPDDNAIYFDDVFVAAQAKRAARQLGTDGDMAAVGVIAHEMGHAVAIQLGYLSHRPYDNEATADCLAGAFARRAGADGSLEPGDVEEAFYAMYTAGDPAPRLTGDPRIDRRVRLRAAVMGHGTREQRMENFRAGLEGGPQACLPDFDGID